jgi:hypothetical protein
VAAISPVATPRARPPGRLNAFRLLNIVALIGAAVGLFLTWATDSFASISGFKLNDGKFFGVEHGKVFGIALIVTALLLLWRVRKANPFNGMLLFLGWLGGLALTAYEVTFLHSVAHAGIGVGLYLDAALAVVGALTAVVDTTRYWSRADGNPRRVRTHWWTWFALVLAVAAVVVAGVAGHRVKFSYPGTHGRTGTTTTVSSGNSGNTGNSGDTGNTGNSGSSGSGTSPFGNSGSSGNSGNSGGTATTAPAGNSGNSGNSG